jgi:hypothetical protein
LKYDENGCFDFDKTEKTVISYIEKISLGNHHLQSYESISSFLSGIEMETNKQKAPLLESAFFSSEKDHFSTFLINENSFPVWADRCVTSVSAIHARNTSVPENIEWLNDEQEYKYVKGLHEATHWSPPKAVRSLQLLGYSVSSKVIDRVWSECFSCGKERRLAPSSKLNPHAVESITPLHRVHIDHVQMTNSNNQKYIITMVCDLTKFMFTQASSNKEVGPVIRFLTRVESYSNFRIKVLSLDNAFDGHEMTEWATQNDVVLEYRPSSASRGVLVERYHRTLREHIKTCSSIPSQWSFHLQKATQSINNEISDSHGFQPSYLLSGHLTDPIQGPLIDSLSEYSFKLKLAKAVINFKKRQNCSNYKFRTLDKDQRIVIQYDHSKSGKKLLGTVSTDLGVEHSTVTAKIDKRHLPIKIHKTDILIPKEDPNYSKIFSDLRNSVLPENFQPLAE